MMQFIIKMQIERQGVSLHLVFTLLQHSQGRPISARDQCIRASKSIFIPSTGINLRFRLYEICTRTSDCLAKRKLAMHGQTHPACGHKTFFYFAMMMCEGSLKAHIPKLKAKSNYFSNKKTQACLTHPPLACLCFDYSLSQ